MNENSQMILERAYQSYLYGADKYTYRYESKNPRKIKEYKDTLNYLQDEKLILIHFISDDKARLSLTDFGIDYCNSNSL